MHAICDLLCEQFNNKHNKFKLAYTKWDAMGVIYIKDSV